MRVLSWLGTARARLLNEVATLALSHGLTDLREVWRDAQVLTVDAWKGGARTVALASEGSSYQLGMKKK